MEIFNKIASIGGIAGTGSVQYQPTARINGRQATTDYAVSGNPNHPVHKDNYGVKLPGYTTPCDNLDYLA